MFSAPEPPPCVFNRLFMALELFREPCRSQSFIQAALNYHGTSRRLGSGGWSELSSKPTLEGFHFGLWLLQSKKDTWLTSAFNP